VRRVVPSQALEFSRPKRIAAEGGAESSDDDETKASKAKKAREAPAAEPEYENDEEYEEGEEWSAEWAYSYLSAAQLHYFTDTVESVDPATFEIKKAVKLGAKGRKLFSPALLQFLVAFGQVKGQ
jgi:hypothetical protein